MKLSFYGAAQTVTGSCFLLEGGGMKILIDCGLFQGSAMHREFNAKDFGFEANSIDCVLLTHAHIDHSGRLPKLVKEGYSNPVYTTAPTIELCEIMLLDSAHIQQSDAEADNRKNLRRGLPLIEPLYNEADVEDTMKLFRSAEYGKMVQLNRNVRFCFTDAGHMLGSSSIQLWVTENNITEKIVFSGDIGNMDKPLLNNPVYIEEADYVICESTYGSRNHSEKQEEDYLLSVIKETLRKGGNLVIPAFAVGRTQELLYELNKYKENGMLGEFSDVRVIVDSPMAIKATSVFKRFYNVLDKNTQSLIQYGDDPLIFENLEFAFTTEESKLINADDTPKIIISASGMADAGRIRHHIKHNVYRPESTILFVGYQAEHSLGRTLLSGEKSVKLLGETLVVNARIEMIDYFSAHADKAQLLIWLNHINCKKRLILVHGELPSSVSLAEELRQFDYAVNIPAFGDTIELSGPDSHSIGNEMKFESYNEDLSELAQMISEKLKDASLQKNNDIDKIKRLLDNIDSILSP